MSVVINIKILFWNIGNRSIEDKIFESLLCHNADIIVLAEIKNKKCHFDLQDRLRDAGWRYQNFSKPPIRYGNGILIISKIKFVVRYYGDTPEYSYRWAEIYIPEYDLSILGIHIPCEGSTISGYHIWPKLIKYAESNINRNSIITGDFNVTLDRDCCERKKDYIKFMKQFINVGFIDAWRHTNPVLIDGTWVPYYLLGTDDPGYRNDYIFISPSLKGTIIKASHCHYERTKGYSDHAQIILVLNIEAAFEENI